ncbi:hypothetical protein GLOIN_2v1503809 [Rhizophagus clarus]|uniref:Uncharacterized protein n=1 Tax=Rhizophagus clarus TaxID=94130 RepID=A0A8H3KUI7_9GLOM|nr:hypothetical protein GLOIN_2v1503809 [Rhizophagus clarus]
MEQIATRYKEVNGHIHSPLIDMIAIDHIIFDKLYIFLRITDQLWELENKEFHNWEYTSLMGDDKEKVLRFFNLKLLFGPFQAQLI